MVRKNYRLEARVENPGFVKLDPFNYSIGSGNAVDEALKKKRLEGPPLFRDTTKAGIQSDDIKWIGDMDTQAYKMMLVPLGFTSTEAKQTLGHLTERLSKAFTHVKMGFSYSTASVSIDVDHQERFAFFPKRKPLRDLRDSLYDRFGIHGLTFILNMEEYIGGGGMFSVISGKNEHSLYLGAHELGHHLGLNDGYERFYKHLHGSELCTHLSKLPGVIQQGVKRFQPPLYRTGNVYKGHAVYRFSEKSIMTGDSSGYQKKLENGEPVFNPLQNHVMGYVAKKAQHNNLRDILRTLRIEK